METFLISLSANVQEIKSENPRIIDRYAVAIGDKIDYDIVKYDKAMGQQGVITRIISWSSLSSSVVCFR